MLEIVSTSQRSLVCFSTMSKLLSFHGGWRAKLAFDETVSGLLQGKEPDLEQLSSTFASASGKGAAYYAQKLGQILHTPIPCPVREGPFEAPYDLSSIEHAVSGIQEAERYLEELCDLLGVGKPNVSVALSALMAKSELGDRQTDQSMLTHGMEWSCKILGLERVLPEVRIETRSWASKAWRRWHLIDNRPTLLLEENDRTLPSAKWYVWRALHDGTHLVHMNLCVEIVKDLTPERLLLLEAVAMSVELDVSAKLEAGDDCLERRFGSVFGKAVRAQLLLGLFERALRHDYDVRIHLHGEDSQVWRDRIVKRFGVSDTLEFVEAFHGIAGLGACYLLGGSAVSQCQDKRRLMLMEDDYDLTARRIDPLSRSPKTDIPSRIPAVLTEIQEVGTVGTRALVQIKSGNEDRTLAVTVESSVKLGATQRGIHMSRIQEAIISMEEEVFGSIAEAAESLCRTIVASQNATAGRVELCGHETLRSMAPVSRRTSSRPIDILATASIDGPICRTAVGVTLSIITACPCTLAYSRLKLERSVAQAVHCGASDILFNAPPTFTHSQPGKLHVKVESAEDLPLLSELIRAVETSCLCNESVLKREDEHRLVEMAHRRPQFAEDVCRAAGAAVASVCGPRALVSVIVELDESIHPHRVRASMHGEANKLWLQIP